MSISVECGQCKKHYRVPESKAGKTIHCPNCKGPVEIPALASQASTSPPSAPASPPRQSPPQPQQQPPAAPAPNVAYPSQAYPAAPYQQYPAQPYPAQHHPAQGQQPYPAAQYPQSPAQYPAQAFPVQPYPMPQAPQAYPTQPYPAQSYPPSPYPGQAYPPQPYPGQPVQAYPMSPQAGVPAGVGGLLGTLGQMDASANAGSPFPAPAASSPYGIGGGGMASLPSYGPARRPGKSVASFLASHLLIIMVAILALFQFVALLADGSVFAGCVSLLVPGFLVGCGLLPKTEQNNMMLIRFVIGVNVLLFAILWIAIFLLGSVAMAHVGVPAEVVGNVIGGFIIHTLIFTVVWTILYYLMKALGCINVLSCVYLLVNALVFVLFLCLSQAADARRQDNHPPRFSQTITVPDLPQTGLALGGP